MHSILRLSAVFFALVAIGCAALKPAPREPIASAPTVSAAEVVGTWSLTDDENATFDVRLSASGSAVSNWSKGPSGAAGEQGRWSISGDRVVVDYVDGWRDCIIRTADGRFRKESFSPSAPREGAATNSGIAVRTAEPAAVWTGVYAVAAAGGAEAHHIAVQSTGLAHKSTGSRRTGAWWVSDGALWIRWTDGGTTELRATSAGFSTRSWRAASTLDAQGIPVAAPTSTAAARRAE
jgi:hypothetical protein